MKEILFNLALLDTTSFCRENKIDCSGTHLVKNGRGFKYDLVKSDTKNPVVTVEFIKNGVPKHYIHN